MNHLYLVTTQDGYFSLLSYIPNRKYLSGNARIFELSGNTPVQHIYDLMNQSEYQEEIRRCLNKKKD